MGFKIFLLVTVTVFCGFVYCEEDCGNNTYGPGCLRNCGKCENNETCDSVSGICNMGCEPGFQLPRCDRPCLNKTYGANCSRTCGKCNRGLPCDPVTGMCINGCMEGYGGDRCKVNTVIFQLLSRAFIIAGIIVAVVYTSVMVVCCCLCWRARKQRKDGVYDDVTSQFELTGVYAKSYTPSRPMSFDARFLNRLDNLMSFKGGQHSRNNKRSTYRATSDAFTLNDDDSFRNSVFSTLSNSNRHDYENAPGNCEYAAPKRNLGPTVTSGGQIYANGILIKNEKEGDTSPLPTSGYANLMSEYKNLKKTDNKPNLNCPDYLEPCYTPPVYANSNIGNISTQ